MTQTITVSNLIERGMKAMDSLEPFLAIQFLTRALEMDGNSVQATELIGWAFMELSNTITPEAPIQNGIDLDTCMTNAYNYLSRAVELNPSQGFEKYFYLGQLSTGLEAVQYYQKGIEILSHQFKSLDSTSEEAQLLIRKWSSALCSLTELYMTDLCDLPDAESNCETFMSKAVEIDPKNPEIYQTFASVRLSQCRPEDAASLLKQGLQIWYKKQNRHVPSGEVTDADTTMMDQENMNDEEDEELVLDPSWPVFSSRLSQAKLFIEVQEFDCALQVLETCQLENDEDPEIWYLYGLSYSLMAVNDTYNDEEKEVAVESSKESFQTLSDISQRLGIQDDPDVMAMMNHAQEILSGNI